MVFNLIKSKFKYIIILKISNIYNYFINYLLNSYFLNKLIYIYSSFSYFKFFKIYFINC